MPSHVRVGRAGHARPDHAQGAGQGARRPLLERRRVPLRPRGRRPRRCRRCAGRRGARRRRADRDPRHRGHAGHGPARRHDAGDAAGHLAVGVHRRRGRPRPACPRRTRRNKRPWLLPLLIGIAVLAVAGIVALLIANAMKNDAPEAIAVPAVAEHDRRPRPRRRSRPPTCSSCGPEEASDTVEAEHVIKTDPAERHGGQGRGRPSPSTSPPVPPASPSRTCPGGPSRRPATSSRTCGLVVAANRQDDDNPAFPQGQVTKTEPAAGTSVSAGVDRHALRLHRQRRWCPTSPARRRPRRRRSSTTPKLAGQHLRGGVRRSTPGHRRRAGRRARHAGQAGPGHQPADRHRARPRRRSRTTWSARPTTRSCAQLQGLGLTQRQPGRRPVRAAGGHGAAHRPDGAATRSRWTSRSTSTCRRVRATTRTPKPTNT